MIWIRLKAVLCVVEFRYRTDIMSWALTLFKEREFPTTHQRDYEDHSPLRAVQWPLVMFKLDGVGLYLIWDAMEDTWAKIHMNGLRLRSEVSESFLFNVGP